MPTTQAMFATKSCTMKSLYQPSSHACESANGSFDPLGWRLDILEQPPFVFDEERANLPSYTDSNLSAWGVDRARDSSVELEFRQEGAVYRIHIVTAAQDAQEHHSPWRHGPFVRSVLSGLSKLKMAVNKSCKHQPCAYIWKPSQNLSSSCASTLHLRSEHGPVALAVTGFGTLEEHDTILHKHPHALQRYVYAPFCEEQTPARLVKPRILSRHHDLVDFDGQMYSWETGLWGAMKLRNVNTRECIAVVQTLGTKAFSGASGNIHITAAGFHMVDLIVSSAMTVALDEMLVWADA